MDREVICPVSDCEGVAAFVKGHEREFKQFRRVMVAEDRTWIEDLNRRRLVFPGITFGHAALEPLLRVAGATFTSESLRTPPARYPREFAITAVYPWGHDRVL